MSDDITPIEEAVLAARIERVTALGEGDRIQMLAADEIVAGNNDRTVFDPAGLADLAQSIGANGLQQPIVVRLYGGVSGKAYQIVAGERRFRACATILKWTEVPCIVRALTDEEASAIMLAENTGRRDLDPVDEAFAYHRRMQEFGWDYKQVADKAGVSPGRVQARLKLVSVRADILHMVRSGNLPVGHAECLAELDHNRQMIALRPLQSGKRLNQREFRKLVDQLLAAQAQESLFDVSALDAPVEPTSAPSVALPTFPTAQDLPVFRVLVDGTGPSLLAYIRVLIERGQTREAEVVGTVLEGLVKGNSARLPYLGLDKLYYYLV